MKLSAIVASVLFACCAVSAAPAPDAVTGNLIFLESTDNPGKLPQRKIASSMSELVRAMNLPAADLPRVLVLHVSAKAARAAGIERYCLRRNSGKVRDIYYELWIVGDANPVDYTAAFEQVLERHFALTITGAERKRMLTRVLRMLDATIDAHGE